MTGDENQVFKSNLTAVRPIVGNLGHKCNCMHSIVMNIILTAFQTSEKYSPSRDTCPGRSRSLILWRWDRHQLKLQDTWPVCRTVCLFTPMQLTLQYQNIILVWGRAWLWTSCRRRHSTTPYANEKHKSMLSVNHCY